MPSNVRHPAVVRATHWLVALCVLVLLLSGIAILLAHPRLYWGEAGALGGPSLVDLPLPFILDIPIRGPGRYLHFLAAWIVVFTGVVYASWGLLTRHFRDNVLPARGTLRPAALRTAIREHLRWPVPRDFASYNALQRLAYSSVVFLLAPALAWTGLAMSPGATSVVPFLASSVGGQQSARTLHFVLTLTLLAFVAGHVAMAALSGFRRRMRAMTTGRETTTLVAATREGVTRRTALKAGLGALAGAGAFGFAIKLIDRCGLLPANHRGIYGASETLTYAGQRLLTTLPSTAREFERSEISQVIPVNGPAPTGEPYATWRAKGFADWRLRIEGMVERPMELSLAEIKALPSRSQITHQACEEGWSFIAEWTGVPLSAVLEHVGTKPGARWVFFFTFDEWWDSIDMADALHAQTLLAYGMNGGELPADHGAPLRLKVARQLGYKSLKYLTRMVVTDDPSAIGDGLGSGSPSDGYSWYAGI